MIFRREDKVLKPLSPVEGMREHERAWVLVRPLRNADFLWRLFGTLDKTDANSMRETIDNEFGNIEGQW